MVLDPNVRRSILRILSEDRDAEYRSIAIAEELGLDVDLVEASLEVMQDEGLVRVRKYLGGGWGAQITSRGYLEAHSLDDEATQRGAGAEIPAAPSLVASEVRARLREQMDKVEELIGRGASVTLEDIKEWVDWTRIVIKRGFGDDSERVSEFQAVMNRPWRGPVVPNLAGYIERLPEWHRLLKIWIREIDEFEVPSDLAEQYIRPRSQFDAYVLLKDMMQTATVSLMVVDPYTDDETLQLLRTVSPNVHARVLTVQAARDFAHVLKLFRQQWGGKIEARQGSKELHDRFLLIDDKVFFSGASFKDLGRRGSFMAEIRTEAIKQAVKKDIEAWWKAAQPIA